MRLACLLIVLTAGWTSLARAAECGDQTQTGLTGCANASYQASDRALNAVYKDIVARLATDAPARKLLADSQKAWIAFRDAECAFKVSSSLGGSIYPMEMAICLDERTRARLGELRAYLKCEEGDLSCPVPAK